MEFRKQIKGAREYQELTITTSPIYEESVCLIYFQWGEKDRMVIDLDVELVLPNFIDKLKSIKSDMTHNGLLHKQEFTLGEMKLITSISCRCLEIKKCCEITINNNAGMEPGVICLGKDKYKELISNLEEYIKQYNENK